MPPPRRPQDEDDAPEAGEGGAAGAEGGGGGGGVAGGGMAWERIFHEGGEGHGEGHEAPTTHELAQGYAHLTKEKHGGDMVAAAKDPAFKAVTKELKARGVTTTGHLAAALDDTKYKGGKEVPSNASKLVGGKEANVPALLAHMREQHMADAHPTEGFAHATTKELAESSGRPHAETLKTLQQAAKQGLVERRGHETNMHRAGNEKAGFGHQVWELRNDTKLPEPAKTGVTALAKHTEAQDTKALAALGKARAAPKPSGDTKAADAVQTRLAAKQGPSAVSTLHAAQTAAKQRFPQGTKVRAPNGQTHVVADHVGAHVVMTDGSAYHHTDLSKAPAKAPVTHTGGTQDGPRGGRFHISRSGSKVYES